MWTIIRGLETCVVCSQQAQTSMKRSYKAVTTLTEVSLNAPVISGEDKTADSHEGNVV